MTDTADSLSPLAGRLPELAKIGQIAANSWTLSTDDAEWVAGEAARRRNEPVYIVGESLHRAVMARVGYYPSAREVGAIVRAVYAATPEPSDV